MNEKSTVMSKAVGKPQQAKTHAGGGGAAQGPAPPLMICIILA
jgi:hypothetical protein